MYWKWKKRLCVRLRSGDKHHLRKSADRKAQIEVGNTSGNSFGADVISHVSYINDLPTQLESSCAIFADDTTVHAASSDSKLSCARISADLDVAAEWADSWGMLFSAEKSEHVHIRKATGQRVTMRGTGVPIPQVKHHHHLGWQWNLSLRPPDKRDHLKIKDTQFQSHVQSNLWITTTEGTGKSGLNSQVVSIATFGSM